MSEELQEKSSGTMRKMSDEEVREMHQKQQNQPRTLSVDRSEVVDNVFSKTGDNITYEIDGVTFTNAQMKACKEVIRNAISLCLLREVIWITKIMHLWGLQQIW